MNNINKEIENLTNRWNDRALDWDRNLSDSSHYSNFERSYEKTDCFVEKYLKKFFRNIIVNNAIDLGCGTGESTKKLSSYSRNVFGIDIASDMIKRAQSKKKE